MNSNISYLLRHNSPLPAQRCCFLSRQTTAQTYRRRLKIIDSRVDGERKKTEKKLDKNNFPVGDSGMGGSNLVNWNIFADEGSQVQKPPQS